MQGGNGNGRWQGQWGMCGERVCLRPRYRIIGAIKMITKCCKIYPTFCPFSFSISAAHSLSLSLALLIAVEVVASPSFMRNAFLAWLTKLPLQFTSSHLPFSLPFFPIPPLPSFATPPFTVFCSCFSFLSAFHAQ